MSNFQATVYETEPLEGRHQLDGMHRPEHFDSSLTLTRRGKTTEALTYLGPWCSRCGRKGKNCSPKARQTCTLRAIGGAKGAHKPGYQAA